MNTTPKTVATALLAVVNPLLALLLALGVIHWTDEQVGGVYVAANTGIFLVVALLAHFRVGTKTETVSVQGGATAFTTALLGCLVLFNIVHLTNDAIALVAGLEVSLFALIGAVLSREAVTAEITPPPGE